MFYLLKTCKPLFKPGRHQTTTVHALYDLHKFSLSLQIDSKFVRNTDLSKQCLKTNSWDMWCRTIVLIFLSLQMQKSWFCRCQFFKVHGWSLPSSCSLTVYWVKCFHSAGDSCFPVSSVCALFCPAQSFLFVGQSQTMKSPLHCDGDTGTI